MCPDEKHEDHEVIHLCKYCEAVIEENEHDEYEICEECDEKIV